MKITRTILLAAITLIGISAPAQDRFELYGDYSYLHFSPTLTGLSARSFNGGGAGVQLNFLKILGIKGDFQGYGSTTFTRTYDTSVNLPNGGYIPAGTYTTQGNMFTYLFGPVIRIPLPKIKPFGEILFGGSETNAYVNLKNEVDNAGGTLNLATQNPFTLALGGGLDINATKGIAIRLGEFDYVLSRYSNPLTSTGNQNNFRYCGGLVIKY
jgi:opacity protein-like surface antigen